MVGLLCRAMALIVLVPIGTLAQTADPMPPSFAKSAVQVSKHVGELSMPLDAGAAAAGVTERLRFEPYQQIEEMFLRDDVVFLMRHGPTDWSYLDEKDVAPTDCAH